MLSAADPSSTRAVAVSIVRRLREEGHAAYFAGGCVRDELLGLHPTDYDVATDATPTRIAALFPRTAEVGASFGVVLVRAGRATVEVATFRSDGPYSDRRRPDVVHFSDARTDAQRRDFTVNALLLDPLAPAGSPERVVDYVGGMDDLRAGVLRAVGDPAARLAEDHLRALRAVRLAGRMGFRIDPPTAAAIREHASELSGVSRERIGDELRKIMLDHGRARGVGLLQDLALDAPVLEEPHASPPLVVLTALDGTPAFAVCLAAWAIDRELLRDAGSAREVATRWRGAMMLSNDETELLEAVLRDVGLVRAGWGLMPVAQRKRAAGKDCFAHSLTVIRALDRSLYESVSADVRALSATASGLNPQALVTGDDLVGLGLTPGPPFKHILEALYDSQLEDRLGDKASALAAARALAAGAGLPVREPGRDGRV